MARKICTAISKGRTGAFCTAASLADAKIFRGAALPAATGTKAASSCALYARSGFRLPAYVLEGARRRTLLLFTRSGASTTAAFTAGTKGKPKKAGLGDASKGRKAARGGGAPLTTGTATLLFSTMRGKCSSYCVMCQRLLKALGNCRGRPKKRIT